MSDYLAAQNAISFSYATNLEIVTNDEQKLALATVRHGNSQSARQGNMPRAAVSAARNMPGAASSPPSAGTWRISGRASSSRQAIAGATDRRRGILSP
jgi:hypothetical protein